jgi:hypothetical protein
MFWKISCNSERITIMDYLEFLKRKTFIIPSGGFMYGKALMNPRSFEWQKDIVHWALCKGKAALFEDCGLGKTLQQLMWAQAVYGRTGRPVLIVAPLAVSRQTKLEGDKFGYTVNICRSQSDVNSGINITNYEMVSHFDAAAFIGVVLDESSILKCFSGKIRNQIITAFKDTPYKLSCTATPAPNDFMELGNQSEFLGVMRRTEMLATFFVHDGGETSKWRLKGHAASDFWHWLSGWAVVLTTPADLGYDATGYDLPELRTHHITVATDYPEAKTLTERRNARRTSLKDRCQKAADVIAANPGGQWLVWCDLNDEADMLKSLIPSSLEVRGADKPDRKESTLTGFSVGFVPTLITKPSIAGFGLNWQECHKMIFVGLSDSYEMMYQAIRRCWRFGQKHPVDVCIITSSAEGAVKENIDRKQQQCDQMIREMVAHTKDILSSEIHATAKMTEEYTPECPMSVPEWLKEDTSYASA